MTTKRNHSEVNTRENYVRILREMGFRDEERRRIDEFAKRRVPFGFTKSDRK